MRFSKLGLVTVRSLLALSLVSSAGPAAAQLPLGASSAPGAAQADASMNDVVVLGDGRALRGRIVDVVQGDHVSLLLASGQTALVRWAVLAHAERNGAVVASGPAAASGARVEAAPAEAAILNAKPETVRVHIESARPVELEQEVDGPDPEKAIENEERRAGEDAPERDDAIDRARARARRRRPKHWVRSCTSPCDQEVPLASRYRIGGEGVRDTKAFRLAGKPGDTVTITFDGASTAGFVGGVVVASVGVGALAVGVVAMLTAFVDGALDDTKDASQATTIGLVSLCSGVVAGAVGVGMIRFYARSDETQSVGGGGGARGARYTGAIGLRRDVASASAAPVVPGVPAARTVSLFSARF